MNDKTKKPLTTEERDYINKFMHGNLKKMAEREKRYIEIIDRRNLCLEALAPLDLLPGTDEVRKQLLQRIEQVKVLQITPEEFKTALKNFESIEKEVRRQVAAQFKTTLSKEKIGQQTATLNKTLALPPGRAGQFEQEVSRGLLHGGAGPKFKKVTGAMKDAEKDPSEKSLAALEKAARDYLQGYDEDDDTNDEKTQRKAEICRDALLDVAAQRKYAQRLAELQPPPWSGEDESKVRQLQAEMLLDRAPAKKLGQGESGASESFFIPGKDGANAFIFKPGDGENVSGYGWEEGGGAPREVLVSSLNESLKEAGLDCGVSRTSLMQVDHPSLKTPKNGNQSKRVGAAQDFVPSNKKVLSDYKVPGENGKERLNVPTADVHKVMVLDFVTLQLDRNEGNFLCQDGPEGPDGQGKLVPIDAGNALPSREAFEAKRRTFTAGALFGVGQADEPFDKEVLAGIESIDPQKLADSMKGANKTMAEVDPEAAKKVDDASVEMVRRSALFLKAAVGRLKTPAQMGVAYQYALQKVFDAPIGKVDEAIEKAIVETETRIALQKQVDELKPSWQELLRALAWPIADDFAKEDPAYVLEIVGSQRQNPAAELECDALVDELGGIAEARKRVPKIDDLDLAAKLRDLRSARTVRNGEPDTIIAAESGDLLLQEASVDTQGMNPKQKAAAVMKLVYEKEGGDAERNRLVGMGFAKIPVSYGGPKEWVEHIRAWKEYLRLGGDARHVAVGGTGHPGSGETPVDLLANLKMLQAQFEVRTEEVRAGLRQATRVLEDENAGVQQLLTEARQLFQEATTFGAQLPGAIQTNDRQALNGAFQAINQRRLQLTDKAQKAKLAARRIEMAFYKVLPIEELAARFGQSSGRKQVIQNGIDRLINELTGERQPITNYVRWLQTYVELEQAHLKGRLDPVAAYRPMITNEFRKLAIQEFPGLHAAVSRVGTLFDGTEERLSQARKATPTPQALQEIKGRLEQIATELPLLNQQLTAFERQVLGAQALCTPEVRNAAAQNKGKGEVNEILSQAVGDIDKFTAHVNEFKQSLQTYAQKLNTCDTAYLELQKQQPTSGTSTPSTQTQDTTAPKDPTTTPTTSDSTSGVDTQPKNDPLKPLQEELLEPADPVFLDTSAANPTLYFHPNTRGGRNYAVDTGHPGGQWQKVEQFCAYLATHWLANNSGKGGLKFADLGDKQAAIDALVQWGSSGGLAAQSQHAKSTLGGQDVGKAKVFDDAAKGLHPAGTKIWFGTDQHAQAAFVSGPDSYAVYDPNKGTTATQTAAGFVSYAGGASAFVVA